MRTAVFRVLTGLLAIAIGWLLIFGDTSKMSRYTFVMTIFVMTLFAVFAIGGNRPADYMLEWLIGK